MPPSGVVLRPMRDPDDLKFLFNLYVNVRAEEMAQIPWPIEQKLDFLAQQFELQHKAYTSNYDNAALDVIEVEDRPAGRLYVARSKGEIRVIDIGLLPDFRNRGIGAALLGELFDEARATGQVVGIHVEKTNPARRLYDRLGFVFETDRTVYDYLVWDPARQAA